MKTVSTPYRKYRWAAALILAVFVLSAAALTRSSPLTTVELKPVADAQATLPAARPSSLSINQTNTNLRSPGARLLGLPVEARSSISGVLGSDLPGYQARAHGSGFAAQSERHRLAADFTSAGVEMCGGNAMWKLALRNYGYGNALQSVTTAIPLASSNRVEYQHKILTEWYVNGPLGLEQGFTLRERPLRRMGYRVHSSGFGNVAIDHRQAIPANSLDQPLTIALAASGNVRAVVDKGRTGLTLITREGQAALQYTGLAARDATGKQLRAWLEVKGEQLLLKIQDATASYPVVVDPWVQLAKVTASDGTTGNDLGWSMAIDGDTLVAGAPVAYSQSPGAVYVFVKPATGWANMTQVAKLTGSDGALFLGDSVGISDDTIVARGQNAAGTSAVYLFVKPEAGWSDMTETARLTVSATTELFSVAISGNTVLAGDPNALNAAGVVYVWVKPASGWVNATPTAQLTASDGGFNLGGSVAISGNTVVARGVGPADYLGAAYMFVEPSGGWSDITQTAKLTASGGGSLGPVAIDGNTVVTGTLGAAVGAPAYVFVKPATGWADMTETARLTASDQADQGQLFFGVSVAIGGNTVVVGAPPSSDSPDPGAAYVFVEPATGWADMTETAKLISSDGVASDAFGSSAAVLTADAVAVGDPVPRTSSGEGEPGALYVFGSTLIPFSRFGGSLTIDPDAGVFYLSGGFTLGPGGSIDPTTESVTFSVGNYSVTLPPGSFVKYNSGYVYQKEVHGVFLCLFIKFTSTPGTYQLLANRIGGTLSTTTSPVPVTLAIGDNYGAAQMNTKFN
jgi:hypothetical protein